MANKLALEIAAQPVGTSVKSDPVDGATYKRATLWEHWESEHRLVLLSFRGEAAAAAAKGCTYKCVLLHSNEGLRKEDRCRCSYGPWLP